MLGSRDRQLGLAFKKLFQVGGSRGGLGLRDRAREGVVREASEEGTLHPGLRRRRCRRRPSSTDRPPPSSSILCAQTDSDVRLKVRGVLNTQTGEVEAQGALSKASQRMRCQSWS